MSERPAPGRMHADEVVIDAATVAALIAGQFPQWAGLTVEPVHSSGTDNAIFRLGGSLSARFPRLAGAATRIEKEARWLPLLAPKLPLAVAAPVATGRPGRGFPWPWSISPWIDGRTATAAAFEQHAAALSLAKFVHAIREIDASGGPPPGPHNSGRGAPLATRNAAFRRSLAMMAGDFDAAVLARIWQHALSAPPHDGSMWFHGDLQPENLLVVDGGLSGVIDFGLMGAGDPAVDLLAGWTLFDSTAREVYRVETGADGAAWSRGRGWALSFAVIAFPYYRETNPVLAGIARRTIERVLEDA